MWIFCRHKVSMLSAVVDVANLKGTLTLIWLLFPSKTPKHSSRNNRPSVENTLSLSGLRGIFKSAFQLRFHTSLCYMWLNLYISSWHNICPRVVFYLSGQPWEEAETWLQCNLTPLSTVLQKVEQWFTIESPCGRCETNPTQTTF